jgi:ribosomal protein L29
MRRFWLARTRSVRRMTHDEILAEIDRLKRELARLRATGAVAAERARLQDDIGRLAAELLGKPKPTMH